MDVLMIVLRLLHIVTGIFWVGSDLLMTFFVSPTARALGPTGGTFMQGLTRHSRYAIAMPVSSLITVVAGLALYARVSGGFNSAWILSAPGLVLTVGAVAGILAFLEGMLLIGPTMGRLEKLGQTLSEQQGPPSEVQTAEMGRLQARSQRLMYLMTILTLVAVIGMAAARYM